jgi:pimeloyl-ACP methyl ester carboxylesterase/SAM-dependent methyltransferase
MAEDGTTFAEAGGVRLCVQTFGDPRDPAILLISGMSASMDWWDEEFCARLAAGVRYVIRYDHRDTGQSACYPPGAPSYTGGELAADAVAVLDALGVDAAHLVGISMGGAIAQRLALERRERVATLTLISTTAIGPTSPDSPELPPPSPELSALPEPAQPDWSDRAAVIDYIVEGDRRLSRGVFDQPHVRELAGRIVDRSRDIQASMTNHAILDDPGTPVSPRIDQISAPALVIHGTADPLFPYPHAQALARTIPGTTLLPLPGIGHQMPPPATWDTVVPAVLRHTSGGWDEQGDRLAARSLAAGDPTGWFDHLYRQGTSGEVPMPWNRAQPHPLLVGWAQPQRIDGHGRRAVVVGCGLGADAEYVAGLGFDTTAFDIAPAAIREACRRHPHTPVHYHTADLLDPPNHWLHAFDLVVEIITVQALPGPPRRQAIVNVGRLVAPGGTLLAIAAAHGEAAEAGSGPPWPLTRGEIDTFATDGLTSASVELISDGDTARWRACFHRAPAAPPLQAR